MGLSKGADMKILLLIVLLLLPFPGKGATLQIDNQSRYITIIIDKKSTSPCLSSSAHPPLCLVLPLTQQTVELPVTEIIEGTLRFIAHPSADDSLDALRKHTFKSAATFTYQPVGPLKYEQLSCSTPLKEGIKVRLVLQDFTDITCEAAMDRQTFWVYKHNDLHLKLIITDSPPSSRPAR